MMNRLTERNWMLMAVATYVLADLAITLVAVHTGLAVEANPMMHVLTDALFNSEFYLYISQHGIPSLYVVAPVSKVISLLAVAVIAYASRWAAVLNGRRVWMAVSLVGVVVTIRNVVIVSINLF